MILSFLFVLLLPTVLASHVESKFDIFNDVFSVIKKPSAKNISLFHFNSGLKRHARSFTFPCSSDFALAAI